MDSVKFNFMPSLQKERDYQVDINNDIQKNNNNNNDNDNNNNNNVKETTDIYM